jgi:hypothetical protein
MCRIAGRRLHVVRRTAPLEPDARRSVTVAEPVVAVDRKTRLHLFEAQLVRWPCRASLALLFPIQLLPYTRWEFSAASLLSRVVESETPEPTAVDRVVLADEPADLGRQISRDPRNAEVAERQTHQLEGLALARA